MDRQLYQEIVDMLTPFLANTGTRQALVQGALWGEPWLNNIDWTGAANAFTAHLIKTAVDYGSTSAVIALLEEQKSQVGMDRQREIQRLIDRVRNGGLSGNAPSSPQQPQGGGGGTTINIGGSVSGGNVNVGGTQTIYGNQIINQGGGGSGEDTEPQPFEPGARDHVFISYSHKETEWMQQLKTALKPAVRAKKYKLWTDELIQPGDKWRDKIEEGLQRTRVAVLLVSQHFIGSDFIMREEYPTLLEWAEQGKIKLIWIPLGRSEYDTYAPKLKAYQSVSSPSSPLNRMSETELEDAWIDISKAILNAYNSFNTNS